MSPTGAGVIVETLVRSGVDRMFGLVGSTVLEIVDEVSQDDRIDYISARHEQVAVGMATGYALATRRPTASISHVGPGAANQVFGVAAANRDNIPVISITGNEASTRISNDVNHEWPVTDVFRQFTKHSVQVHDHAVYNQVRHAVLQSITGMPGPVHVDVPRDVAESPYSPPPDDQYDRLENAASGGRASRTPACPTERAVERAVELLADAERPIVVAGNEFRWFDASEPLQTFAETFDIPVVTTQSSRGALPETHSRSLGYVANSGLAPSNAALEQADYVLAVGTRLSDQTTNDWALIDDSATLIQASVRADELDRFYSANVTMLADPASTISAITSRARKDSTIGYADVADTTRDEYEAVRREKLSPGEHGGDGIDPRLVVRAVKEHADDDFAYTTGGGSHNTYPRLLPVSDLNGRFVTANFTGMSQGFPLAMGAKLAMPDRQVMTFEGDGGFAMVLQDLETMVREDIPVKIILLNNDAFMSHAIRQSQRYGRHVGTKYGNPAFDQIAEDFGLRGISVSDDEAIDDAVADLLAEDGPALLDVHVDPDVGRQAYE
ncbi:thiamine pyrophosphate-binding protein [Halorarum salinum]|uniref:Thiamine pyrophosphate-binding protein n=1 Tax=Halorarum salinum TaxID=2743089 RepID=A0A7D5L8B9_9EURY|nr:thiamine pyrophosphate-binding protein [Halobaculum salinum]QLG60330.1 thiamine pyrophosphate-binding protein [Halobaculum salinum]